MKLKFISTPDKGIPVMDSFGNQRVVGIISDDNDLIVLIVDAARNAMYIEKVINKFATSMFESMNFTLVSDEEYDAYYKFFVDQGLYVQEKKKMLSKDEIIATTRILR